MSAYWIPFKTFILLVLACPQLLWSHVHAALPEFIFCVAHSHKRKTRSLTLRKCHCTITCVIAASHQRWFDHSTLKSKYYCSFITHRLVIQASVGGQTDRHNKEILFNKGEKKERDEDLPQICFCFILQKDAFIIHFPQKRNSCRIFKLASFKS